MQRFRFAADRDAFLAAHGLLRLMLAAATGRAPESLRFTASPAGKPLLDGDPEGFHFSLAHSRRWVACAVAPIPVGIDVEAADRPVPALVLDRFAPAEARLVRALPATEVRRAFYRLWTLKEAILKATGEGLRRSLASFAVSLEPLAVAMPGGQADDWQLAEFSAGRHHPVALAASCSAAAPVAVRAARLPAAALHAIID